MPLGFHKTWDFLNQWKSDWQLSETSEIDSSANVFFWQGKRISFALVHYPVPSF